ncbi:MAG: c-type cytochrome [Acidobacteriota bacterium]
MTPWKFSLSYRSMLVKTSMLILLGLPLTLVSLSQNPEKPKEVTNPFSKDKAAIEAGRIQYQSGCTVCHGPTGQGGRGSRLANVDRVRRMTDERLFDIIRQGISGTQMPPSSLADSHVWQLVSFVRSLNASAIDEDVAGDATAGQSQFFGGARCAECHMIGGRGGLVGPDLSNIGASRPLLRLRSSIEDPDAFIEPGFQHVSATLKNGKRLTGVVKNQSNYSIQIQDQGGRFHSLKKRDLRELVFHRRSLMPKPSLSDDQIQNLLAFLSRQTTESQAGGRRRVEHGKEVAP